MNSFLIQIFCLFLVIIVSMIPAISARSTAFQDDESSFFDNSYPSLELDKAFRPVQKRDCVRRGGSCTYRPGGCCEEDACRCNVWGANCRCYNIGISQKWV